MNKTCSTCAYFLKEDTCMLMISTMVDPDYTCKEYRIVKTAEERLQIQLTEWKNSISDGEEWLY